MTVYPAIRRAAMRRRRRERRGGDRRLNADGQEAVRRAAPCSLGVRRSRPLTLGLAAAVAACGGGAPGPGPHRSPAPTAHRTPAPRGVDARRAPRHVDVYAAGRPGRLSPVVAHDPARVYVPNSESNSVSVLSQRTGRVLSSFSTGALPQHVTPSWDLRTLWVSNDKANQLTPIDPRTGRPGRPVPVADPYNLYFTADGRRAIVVAEARRELDFRDPHTMRLRHSLRVPQCAGVDHMDFTADGGQALVSCEFAARMIVVDLRRERVLRSIALRAGAMPQDVKLSPDGRTFYVADMAADGVWLIDAHTWHRIRLQPTGRGAHGLYPSRDSARLFVSNRDEGTISVLSFRTRRPIRKWRIPGSASPDMGGVSASGRVLWLSGRYDGEVYALSTRTGRLLHRVPVGTGPHGLCVWPQPGRYSIGHTGILR
jgi:YVTN family beta-propeller protein